MYFAYAAKILDYQKSVEREVMDKKNTYINIFTKLLIENGKLEIVQGKYSPSDEPWLFLTFGASVLVKDSKFCIVEGEVSKTVNLPKECNLNSIQV